MNRTRLRDLDARAGLKLARKFGVEISFSHEGGDAVTLYAADSADELTSVLSDDVDIDQTSKTFTIPRQTSFPPQNGITTGDEITCGEIVFEVVKSSANELGSAFTLETVRQRATTLRGA